MKLPIAAALIAGALLPVGLGAQAGEMVNNVEFHPSFSATGGLSLAVQNYSKLPRPLDGVDVYLGGDATHAACRVTLPAIALGPAERTTAVVATPAMMAACARGAATARDLPRLARVMPSQSARMGPVMRISPRFPGINSTAPLVYRIGTATLPPPPPMALRK